MAIFAIITAVAISHFKNKRELQNKKNNPAIASQVTEIEKSKAFIKPPIEATNIKVYGERGEFYAFTLEGCRFLAISSWGNGGAGITKLHCQAQGETTQEEAPDKLDEVIRVLNEIRVNCKGF